MNNITILSKEIRQIDGLYCLNDLHKASGGERKHQPSLFLSNQVTKKLISAVERSRNSCIALKTKRGGGNQGTYACKQIVLSYGMWINPEVNLAVIDAFLDNEEDKPKSLTPAQQCHIQSRVKHLAYSQVGSTFGSLYGQIQRSFKVGSYKQVLEEQYPSLCRFLGCEPLEVEHIPNDQPRLPNLGRYDRALVSLDECGKMQAVTLPDGAIISTFNNLPNHIKDSLNISDESLKEIIDTCLEKITNRAISRRSRLCLI